MYLISNRPSQDEQGPPSEERAHGTVSLTTYYRYFRAGGSHLFLAFLLVLLFIADVSDAL